MHGPFLCGKLVSLVGCVATCICLEELNGIGLWQINTNLSFSLKQRLAPRDSSIHLHNRAI